MTYVAKVSKAGVNVLTATDPNDFIFNSELNTFKIIAEGNLTSQTVDASPKVFTVAHGRALTPTVYAFALFPDGEVALPNEVDYGFTGRWWLLSVDATNIKFTFYKGSVESANTIYKPPGPASNDNAVGNVQWDVPDYCRESDDNYSAVILSTGDQSYWLRTSGFGFDIPTDATIVGIIAQFEGHYSGAIYWTLDYIRIIKGGSIGATNKTVDLPAGSDGTDTCGGSNDLWGESWTPADINSSEFGIATSTVFSGSGSRTIYIDQVMLKVYYTQDYSGDYEVSTKYYIFEAPGT